MWNLSDLSVTDHTWGSHCSTSCKQINKRSGIDRSLQVIWSVVVAWLRTWYDSNLIRIIKKQLNMLHWSYLTILTRWKLLLWIRMSLRSGHPEWNQPSGVWSSLAWLITLIALTHKSTLSKVKSQMREGHRSNRGPNWRRSVPNTTTRAQLYDHRLRRTKGEVSACWAKRWGTC